MEKKMPEGSIKLGSFGFGIFARMREDGKIEYDTQIVNSGIMVEIIVMQLRSFLNSLEKNYFDDFNKRISDKED